jgi:hypothetical protein
LEPSGEPAHEPFADEPAQRIDREAVL